LGDIGGGELLVIFLAALLLFGSKRLPEMARTLGRLLESLRQTSRSFRDELLRPVNDDATAPNETPTPDRALEQSAAPEAGDSPAPLPPADQSQHGAPPDERAG